MYKYVQLIIYIISILLSMLGLSCFKYEEYIKRSKIREFYLLYIIMSVVLGYLFGSFILNFTDINLYS